MSSAAAETPLPADPWAKPLPSGMAPVPPAYWGVWSRTLLEAPGLRDDTTLVRWMQLGRWHADLRVPLNPAGQRTTALASQQGFSGVTEVSRRGDSEVCSWHRVVDYQPPGPFPDAGEMRFETPDRVIETGIHGVYREVWERLPLSTSPLIALGEPPRADGQPSARLFIAGHYLMRVRPLPLLLPLPLALPLSAALLPNDNFEISFGTLQAGDWRIAHATLPALEGTALALQVQRTSGEAAWVQCGPEAGAWRVLEWQGSDTLHF